MFNMRSRAALLSAVILAGAAFLPARAATPDEAKALADKAAEFIRH